MKKILIICALIIAPALYAQNSVQTEVVFHGFSWGTSLQEFTAKMGNPAHTDEFNGLKSLVYDKIIVSGYPVFLLAYFSQNGLEGGTYYFDTNSLDELMKCYSDMQKELLNKYGPARGDEITKERRPYETCWDLLSGFVYLNVNTRQNDPVSVWFSSPALTKKLIGS